MPISVRTITPADISSCSNINRSLPDWFGIDEGLAEADSYLRDHAGLIAESDGETIGYLTYDLLFPESAEISWMAVAASSHRRGVGRRLIGALESHLHQQGVQLLTVKTLAESHPSPEYAITRAFYTSLGFRKQMVVPELWDPANPCLFMVKALASV